DSYLNDALDHSGGSLIDTITYDGFDVVTSESSTANGDRYKFTGREFDSESGLQYNDARYYDPKPGRWYEQDPLGLGPDPNVYRYVRNNPTTAIDPTGLAGKAGDVKITPVSLGDFAAEIKERFKDDELVWKGRLASLGFHFDLNDEKTFAKMKGDKYTVDL